MLSEQKISQTEYDNAVSQGIVLTDHTQDSQFMYSQMVHLELHNILNNLEIEAKNLTIHTYFDTVAQEALDRGYAVLDGSTIPEQDKIMMLADNATNAIIAFSGSKLDNTMRQCGSLIKPVLCYASGFEKNTFYPASQILDEAINYNGYAPHNVDGSYHGWVSTRYALSHSLNIPAVKALDYVGLDYAIPFAKKFGIPFRHQDNHLALALGAMQQGTTIQQMLDTYITFANSGKYAKSGFISKIVDAEGNILYARKVARDTACMDSTAFLINDILLDCSKSGTAKKIGTLGKNIASKTGTVGSSDHTNTDAWCVSYTPKHTIISWCGNTTADTANNLAKIQNGGTICSNSIYTTIKNYKNMDYSTQFSKPKNVNKHYIDKDALENDHLVCLSDTDTGISDYFVDTNLPKTANINDVEKFIIKYNQQDNAIFWENGKNSEYVVFCTDTNGKIKQIPFDTKDNINIVNVPTDTNKIWVQRTQKGQVTQSNTIELFNKNKTSIFKKLSKIWLR